MRSLLPSLRSSFGRKILLLFSLCIVVPGAVFGYLSLRQVEEKFQQDVIRRMRLHAQEIGMAVHSGLGSIDLEVEFLAGILGNGTNPDFRRSSDWGWLFQKRSLLGATRFRDGSRAEPLYGNPCPPPPQTDTVRSHLSSGRGLLYMQRNAGGSLRIFLARAIPGKAPERELLACEVNPAYLWEGVRNHAPPAEAAVLSPDGTLLFQTKPLPGPVLDRVEEDRHKGGAGDFEWGQGSGTLLVNHIGLYLKSDFLSDKWIVVSSQPRSEAFAAAKSFTRALFLSITLVVLIAGFFALVLIRRSVAPLAVLKEGTRRISGGDFDSRVMIGSGDEFEELARSFNAMAGHLGREFRNQAEMGRIVQTILGETAKEKIVEVLLDNVAVIVPCDCVGLSLVEPGVMKNAAITYIREDASVVPSVTGKTILPLCADEIRRMISAGDGVLSVQAPDFGHFFSRWRGARLASFLLAPLVSSGDLAGVLILGYRNLQDPAREILVRIRQIADQAAIALSRARLLEELSQNDLGTLMALARTVDANSPWTAGHSERVTRLSMEIGRELGLPSHEIDLLRRGGLLHDIGKLGVPLTILDKPGKLTEEEIAVMQRHPGKGAEILEPIPNLQKVIPMVSQHHERFDGKGYPKGLSGEYISLHARILALADVADALLSDRPYRSGWQREKVLLYVRENSGLHFDPTVVEAFQRMEAGRRDAPHAELAATGT